MNPYSIWICYEIVALFDLAVIDLFYQAQMIHRVHHVAKTSLRAFAPSSELKRRLGSREAAKARRGFGLQRLGHSLPTVETI